MRVLIIAYDEKRAQHIANGIDWRGFRCDFARTLSSADVDMAGIAYDVVILILPLPDGDGLEWLSRRRLTPTFRPSW